MLFHLIFKQLLNTNVKILSLSDEDVKFNHDFLYPYITSTFLTL